MKQSFSNVYFLGIGGIGMSALAKYFLLNGMQVAGYDKTPSVVTKQLEDGGIRVFFDDSPSFIPAPYQSPKTTLVVYTPAIPNDHKGKRWFEEQGFILKKRSVVLGDISNNHSCLGVAGTHGKTTTSAILTHILHHAQQTHLAFVGGIVLPYNTNFIYKQPFKEDTFMVAEADEYDRSFLQLHPDSAIITSAQPDHLDIYGDHDSLLQSFKDFASLVDDSGYVIVHEDLVNEFSSLPGNKNLITYGFGHEANVRVSNVQIEYGVKKFDLEVEGRAIRNWEFTMPGEHNLLNAVAAITLALKIGITERWVWEAVRNFKGVKRRFEVVVDKPEGIYIDDYAHHPDEIRAFIQGIRELYPDEKLSIIFQPHLFSRTRDFAQGFAQELDKADEVILLPIYPAREEPIEGVSSTMISELMTNPNKRVLEKKAAMEYVELFPPKLLATLGAGDIDRLVKPIQTIYERRQG